MLTDRQKKDLKYLRSRNEVLVPPSYTFWLHHTSYNNPEHRVHGEKGWNEIPTESFVVSGRRLSCVSARDWMQGPVGYGKTKPSYTYSCYNDAEPFRIVIMQPRHNHLADMYEGEELEQRYNEEEGIDDRRHQKIERGTVLHIFACKNRGKNEGEIDTIYCVREQDLIDYAANVRVSEYYQDYDASKENYGLDIDMPNRRVTETNQTKVLFGNGDFSRFVDRIVYEPDGKTKTLVPAPYKIEHLEKLSVLEEQGALYRDKHLYMFHNENKEQTERSSNENTELAKQ